MKERPVRLLLVVAALCGCASSDHVDTAVTEVRVAQAGPWTVQWAPDPDPLPYNEPFALVLTVEGQPLPATVRVRADMPEHGHGMPTDPVVTALGDGRYRAEGMLFQMTGRWELVMNLDSEEAVFGVTCCP